MVRPLVLLAAVLLSGIITGLGEAPLLIRSVAVMTATGVIVFVYRKSKVRLSKKALLFVLIIFILLFLAGLLLSSRQTEIYTSP